MNKRLQEFARTEIMKDLAVLSMRQRRFFAMMYFCQGLDNLAAELKEDITDEMLNHIVNQIPEAQLSWAMEQTRNTVVKNERAATNG